MCTRIFNKNGEKKQQQQQKHGLNGLNGITVRNGGRKRTRRARRYYILWAIEYELARNNV